jgi:hypothetical protein
MGLFLGGLVACSDMPCRTAGNDRDQRLGYWNTLISGRPHLGCLRVLPLIDRGARCSRLAASVRVGRMHLVGPEPIDDSFVDLMTSGDLQICRLKRDFCSAPGLRMEGTILDSTRKLKGQDARCTIAGANSTRAGACPQRPRTRKRGGGPMDVKHGCKQLGLSVQRAACSVQRQAGHSVDAIIAFQGLASLALCCLKRCRSFPGAAVPFPAWRVAALL